MKRETLKEKIDKREINIAEAKSDIIKFISAEGVKKALNRNFNDFELSSNFINANRFIDFIKENTSDDICFEEITRNNKKRLHFSIEKQVETYLDLVETYYAVFLHLLDNGDISSTGDAHRSFERVIDVNLNKLGYKLNFDNETVKIVLIDSLSDTVAELEQYREVKWRIIDFNYYKTTIDEKEKILEDLYKLFERDRKYVNNSLATTIADIMNNCIRHSGKKQPCDFYEENKEGWINNLYNLLLNAFIEVESKRIIKEYKKLKT